MKVVLETEAKHLPAIRAFAKTLNAELAVEKESALMSELRGSLKEVAEIQAGKKQPRILKER